MTLSVVIITYNEEANIARTLRSVAGLVRDLGGEIIVVDSRSSDRTVEIARQLGAKVFVEDWKGFAAQKNSAIAKAGGDWVLSLDADEEDSTQLATELNTLFASPIAKEIRGYLIPRRNLFLGRWIRHGGFWPDRKLRLFRRDCGSFEDRLVHEDVKISGPTGTLRGYLLHHSYPTLASYIEHMNRYSSLGAKMASEQRPRGFSLFDIILRPLATFTYNYFFRLGFLDGREGLLLHLYHSVYVSWKYAKAWEFTRTQQSR